VAALSGKDILIDEAGLDHDYFVPRQQSIVWWHFTGVECDGLFFWCAVFTMAHFLLHGQNE
jgi:hypothetical protein